MEHLNGTTPHPAPIAERHAHPTLISERQARADWLITELGRLAADADDPRDGARFRRTADSLIRLSAAFRS